MKVGILTYHHTTNYGATLQVYALYKYLQGLGVDVSVIDYKPSAARIAYLKTNYISPHLVSNHQKKIKFANFVRQHILLTSLPSQSLNGLEQISSEFDLIITGSDEVWNFDSFRGFDKAFFLAFGRSSLKRYSYAASFGQAVNYETIKIELTQHLSTYDGIGVRDTNTLNRVMELTNRTSTLVLDPTFLIDFNSTISNHIRSTYRGKRYILLYGRIPKPYRAEVKRLAEKRKLEIYSVGYFNGIAERNLINAGPAEWIALVAGADFIYTNFYHGLLFSIIFNKPYKFLQSESKKNKAIDIINGLRLQVDYTDAYLDGPTLDLNANMNERLTTSTTFINQILGIQN